MTVTEPTRHLEWEQRTTGELAYAGDVALPGTLVARVLRSPHPHARVRSVDTAAAERSPGVAAVVSAADLPDIRYVHHGGPLSDRYPIARDRVRFVGEEIAAVAAETLQQADDALRRIKVRYRRLPAVLTMDEAMVADAPRLHETSAEGNVSVRLERDYGQASGEEPAVVCRGRYRFGRQTHACMEPGSTLARWDAERERLELWTSTQAPYFIRKEVAHVLGLDMEQVVTHEVGVGGGFGAKSKISDHEVLAAALAMKAGRPVRLVLDRAEEFATTKCRHEFDIVLESSADAAGRLLHREAELRVDNGAYNHSGPSVMGYGCMLLASQYRLPAARLKAELVYTNKHPGGQFRGYGGPQAAFALESQMDELADELGLDPIDLRVRNANRTGDETIAGWRIASSHLVECLEAVRAEIDWDRKRALGGSGRGVGVAAAAHVSGALVYEGAERSGACVDIGSDGQVRVRFGGADAGTWQRTLLAQIAATELGVDADAVAVVMMETDSTPTDFGAWSSRGTYMSGHAVRKAAGKAADALRSLAASKLGCAPSDVRLGGGRATHDGRPIDLADLVAIAEGLDDGWLRFEDDYVTTDAEPFDPRSGVSNLSPTYAFAAQAVEVEVDRDTGAVRILDVVAAHDSGIALNPIAAKSQIVGGVAMGLGAALGEELRYEEGRQVNPAYLNYPLPRAADLPRIRPLLVEHEDPVGPYGAKGIGEIVLVPTAAAVANAVAHATGVRIRDLPITPDKVLTALREADGKARRRHAAAWRRPSRWWIAGVRAAYPRGLHTLLHRYGTRLARRPDPARIERMVRPASIDEALEHLAADPEARLLGGGTDLLPARTQGLANPSTLVDLTSVRGFAAVEETPDGGLRIGGGVRLAELSRHAAARGIGVLRDTVESIASSQIREMATVGGNLCQQKRCWFFRNGFDCYKRGGATCPCYAVLGDHRFHHAAMGAHRCQAVTPSDLATTLAALDATVAVAGPKGTRHVAMEEFYDGPGEPALGHDELVASVTVPAGALRRRAVFDKLRLWQGDFALVSTCVTVEVDARQRVSDCRIVLGAVAPTPLRARRAEQVVRGRVLTERLATRAGDAAVRGGHPLAGNAWKLDALAAMVRRTLLHAAAVSPIGGGDGG